MSSNAPDNKKLDVLEKRFVRLALYLLCGILPVFGFPTALLLARSSYTKAERVSARMMEISAVVMIIWTAGIIYYLAVPILTDIF